MAAKTDILPMPLPTKLKISCLVGIGYEHTIYTSTYRRHMKYTSENDHIVEIGTYNHYTINEYLLL